MLDKSKITVSSVNPIPPTKLITFISVIQFFLTILDKGIIIKQLKTQGQPTQKRRHWRQRAAFLRGG